MCGTFPVAHHDGIANVACGLPLIITSRWVIGFGTNVMDAWRGPRELLEHEEWDKEGCRIHVFMILRRTSLSKSGSAHIGGDRNVGH